MLGGNNAERFDIVEDGLEARVAVSGKAECGHKAVVEMDAKHGQTVLKPVFSHRGYHLRLRLLSGRELRPLISDELAAQVIRHESSGEK